MGIDAMAKFQNLAISYKLGKTNQRVIPFSQVL